MNATATAPADGVDPVTVGACGARQNAGTLKAWVPSVALVVEPWLALNPRPRLAKAVQSRHLLAPPLSARSAAMMASRASTKPGLQGWSLRPSMTSWSAMMLPAVAALRRGPR